MDDTSTRGHHWDLAGNASFRKSVREVQAWLSVTRVSMTPPQPADALQRNSGGLARILAMRAPSLIVKYGATLQ
eukprot:7160723-Pyramimonas_sp.AAC.1